MATQPLIPPTGSRINLKEFDPDYCGDYDKQTACHELKALQEKLWALQERLYAENAQSLLIVLQAMDAGGKDGTIGSVFEGINPQGVQVTGFKVPTEAELAHDFLWRIQQHTPPKGYIGIFNRSHYEDVLVVRVKNLVPESVWRNRYDHINHFEQLLADSGIRILKFYLHISREEQKKRLQSRLDDPEKHWKFAIGDLAVREQWNEYMAAYEDALRYCNTEYAPWHIVPANRKWYRNLIVTKTIVGALEVMNPQYPPPEPGLAEVSIPD